MAVFFVKSGNLVKNAAQAAGVWLGLMVMPMIVSAAMIMVMVMFMMMVMLAVRPMLVLMRAHQRAAFT